MTANAALGVRNATAAIGGHNIPRMCLFYVRTWLGGPGGPSTAALAWATSKYKHKGDANPPAGVPVYFAPNHVALSIGGGTIVSTDWPTIGHIGETTITELAKAWNHPLLGWTSDIDGALIAGVGNVQDVGFYPGDPGLTPINPFNIPGNPDKKFTQSAGALAAWARVAEFLVNPMSQMRIIEFITGSVLIVVAVIGAEHAGQIVKSTGKAVAGNAA